MDPSRALVGHLHRPGHRVVVVDGLGAVVALTQAHAAAAADIDGAVQVHVAQTAPEPAAAAATKLARMRRPTLEDFSGWNWAAHTLSRATAATTGPP